MLIAARVGLQVWGRGWSFLGSLFGPGFGSKNGPGIYLRLFDAAAAGPIFGTKNLTEILLSEALPPGAKWAHCGGASETNKMLKKKSSLNLGEASTRDIARQH